jgi:hypothetical protein
MKLALYDEMRLAIERCSQIDEAANIRDAGARLAAYARIRDDSDSERRFAEIRLRAIRKIGELSRELEKASHERDEHGRLIAIDGDQVSKEKTLAAAGAGPLGTHASPKNNEKITRSQGHQAKNIRSPVLLRFHGKAIPGVYFGRSFGAWDVPWLWNRGF